MAENEDEDQEASAAHDVTDGTPEVGAPIPALRSTESPGPGVPR